MRTGIFVRKHQTLLWLVNRNHQSQTFSQTQGSLEGFSQSKPQVVANFEAVNNDFNRVLFLQIQLGRFVQLVDFAINASADKPLPTQLLQYLHMLTLAFVDDRGKQHPAGILGQRQHRVHHLADGLRLQGNAMLRATRRTGTCIKQAQIIVNFGDSAYG